MADSLVYDIAAYLHQTQHKSKRTVMCRSDVQMAEELVKLLVDKGVLNGEVRDEDDQRS